MEILNLYDPDKFKVYLLVLVRISVILFMIPVFATEMLPFIVKAALSMVLALLLYSVVNVDAASFPETVIGNALLIIAELIIGLILGLFVRLFFASVQLAGQVIGFQMGFSMINVVDPQTGANVSIMEQIAYWVAILVFILFNGHHIIFLSIIESFELVPPGVFVFQEMLLVKILSLGSRLFMLAIKIGAPVIAALLFTSVAFGLTAKFSPQMNIMIVAFPFKIFVGLVLFGLSLEIMTIVTREFVKNLKEQLLLIFFWAGGG